MRFGVTGPVAEGLADQFHGKIMPSHLVRQHAKKMQGLRLGRLRREYLPKEGFSLGKTTGLLVGQSLPQQALLRRSAGRAGSLPRFLQQAGGEPGFFGFFCHGTEYKEPFFPAILVDI
jgi:hypothetical protein